jgi:hypothetical protein
MLLRTYLGKCSTLYCSILHESGHLAAPRLAKSLTCSFESGLVDLAVALDDSNRLTSTVDKCGDLLGPFNPVHCGGVAMESFDKYNTLVGCHGEPIGECLIVDCR